MTREIKFRAWFQEEKEMREVAMLRWEDGRISRIAGYWKETRNNGWTDYDPSDGKVILMQFTGLLDKNGKEIYEGDVIKHISIIENKEKIDVVEYTPNALFNGIYQNGTDEILGNIYMNPNLLKQDA